MQYKKPLFLCIMIFVTVGYAEATDGSYRGRLGRGRPSDASLTPQSSKALLDIDFDAADPDKELKTIFINTVRILEGFNRGFNEIFWIKILHSLVISLNRKVELSDDSSDRTSISKQGKTNLMSYVKDLINKSACDPLKKIGTSEFTDIYPVFRGDADFENFLATCQPENNTLTNIHEKYVTPRRGTALKAIPQDHSYRKYWDKLKHLLYYDYLKHMAAKKLPHDASERRKHTLVTNISFLGDIGVYNYSTVELNLDFRPPVDWEKATSDDAAPAGAGAGSSAGASASPSAPAPAPSLPAPSLPRSADKPAPAGAGAGAGASGDAKISSGGSAGPGDKADHDEYDGFISTASKHSSHSTGTVTSAREVPSTPATTTSTHARTNTGNPGVNTHEGSIIFTKKGILFYPKESKSTEMRLHTFNNDDYDAFKNLCERKKKGPRTLVKVTLNAHYRITNIELLSDSKK